VIYDSEAGTHMIGVPDFYRFLRGVRYRSCMPWLFALRLLLVTLTSGLCEQFFSKIKINKYALRSKLMNDRLESVPRLT